MEKEELDGLIKLVDEFVDYLKKELLSVQVPAKGAFSKIWDKMKNWWQNITKKGGPNDPKNPYLYQNKFGALGQTQESRRLSLSQYKFIRECYEDLESSVTLLSEETTQDSENIKKLKLFQIIDSWADRFKKAIIRQFAYAPQKKPEDFKMDIGAEPKMGTSVDVGDSSAPGLSTRTDTGVQKGEMPKIPEERPSTEVSPEPAKVEEEESLGKGRAGKGLTIQWSKGGFIVKKSIGGKSTGIKLNLEEIKPIKDLLSKSLDEIKREAASAENFLKYEIYDKITTSPRGGRKGTGLQAGQHLFTIDASEFDEKFIEVFKKVLAQISSEYKDKSFTTTGDSLHKRIFKMIFKEIDEIFKERGIANDDDVDIGFNSPVD